MIEPAYKLLSMGCICYIRPKIEVNVMLMKKEDLLAQKVGIDISAHKFDVEFQGLYGKHKAEFKMTEAGMKQFQKWLMKHGCSAPELWMESTGRYYEDLADWACSLGWSVYAVNPRCIRDFARARMQISKSDPLDASIIRRFAECSGPEDYRKWVPLSAGRRELRDLQLVVKGLKKEIVRNQNRLKCGLQSPFAVATIKATIKDLAKSIKSLHDQSLKVIREDAELSKHFSVLMRIKGFGEVSVCYLLAKVDFFKFQKGRQLVKFAGLDVAEWRSGKSVKGKDRISRVGHSDLRSAMYMPALTAIRHDPETARIAAGMQSRNICKKVIICSVMARMLRVAFAAIRDSNLADAA